MGVSLTLTYSFAPAPRPHYTNKLELSGQHYSSDYYYLIQKKIKEIHMICFITFQIFARLPSQTFDDFKDSSHFPQCHDDDIKAILDVMIYLTY